MNRGSLLDTNVPSELTRPQPDPRVARWLEDTDDDLMDISVITVGEVCKGITVHQEAHRRAWLRQWLENELRPWFAGRIPPITEAIPGRWGTLEADYQLKGIGFNAPDGPIAATAREHDLMLVTRNVRDFAALGVAILNPCRGSRHRGPGHAGQVVSPVSLTPFELASAFRPTNLCDRHLECIDFGATNFRPRKAEIQRLSGLVLGLRGRTSTAFLVFCAGAAGAGGVPGDFVA
jgi:predicted nucleic acid-binding protein